MTPEGAFLEDIREQPDDDTPRLIFADWLEDNGDLDRAEFIRAQIALARHADAPEAERAEWQRRCERLLEANWARWVAPLVPHLEAWPGSGSWAALGYRPDALSRFPRGFIEAIEVSADRLVNGAAELFGKHPIRHLRLHLAGEHAERLAGCPYLRWVETLVFADYYRAPMDGRGMNWLADSAPFERLWLLTLQKNYLGDEGARALARAPWLARLKWLSLDDNGLSGEGLAALAQTALPFRPTLLSLGLNEIGEAGGCALARSPILSAVELLILERCGLTEQSAAALADSPHLGSLAELDLRGNALQAGGAARIESAPWRRQLRVLRM